VIYNCHTHTFLDIDIPDKLLPAYLVKILRTKPGNKLITGFLSGLIPFTDKDLLHRYATFARTCDLGSQKKIFEKLIKFYPKGTKFIILPMDMEHMGAGDVPREYSDQIHELKLLRKQYPEQVIPFFHVDPRRTGVLSEFMFAVERHDFRGVKLYPPLGYYPYDKRLYPIYQICENKNLPILAHCSPYNPIHFKGKKKELKKLLRDGNSNVKIKGKNRKELCSMFTNPLNYLRVIKDFPKLRICFGHFGSAYMWDKYLDDPGMKGNWYRIIKDLIKRHDNFYTDISFTLSDRRFFPLLNNILNDKKVRDKVLFGSDYYMVEMESDEKRYGVELRSFIGEKKFKAIATDNPKRFLGE